MSDKTHTASRPAGYEILVDPEQGTFEADTLCCVHCRKHWRVIPGSGRQRGWCQNCNGPTCGPNCLAGTDCVPFEQLLTNIEKGKPLSFRPIIVRGS